MLRSRFAYSSTVVVVTSFTNFGNIYYNKVCMSSSSMPSSNYSTTSNLKNNNTINFLNAKDDSRSQNTIPVDNSARRFDSAPASTPSNTDILNAIQTMKEEMKVELIKIDSRMNNIDTRMNNVEANMIQMKEQMKESKEEINKKLDETKNELKADVNKLKNYFQYWLMAGVVGFVTACGTMNYIASSWTDPIRNDTNKLRDDHNKLRDDIHRDMNKLRDDDAKLRDDNAKELKTQAVKNENVDGKLTGLMSGGYVNGRPKAASKEEEEGKSNRLMSGGVANGHPKAASKEGNLNGGAHPPGAFAHRF